MAPIRAAQVMGYMDGGGVEQVVMNYYRHVDRSRVQFDLLVCGGSKMVPREEVESLGGRVLVVPPYRELPRYLAELRRLFRAERWPIVHSHVNALSVFPLSAAASAGVPVRIAHSHNTGGGEPAKDLAKAALRPLSNAFPTHRMACSRHAGEWLFRGAPFRVLPNAVELSGFAFDPAARAELRAGLGAGPSALVVGLVGRLAPQKNHALLLEAVAELARSGAADPLLVLAGEGDGRAAVLRRAGELSISGRVRLLGQVADVGRLYSALDAFCLPSLYEGLGIVAVEAQRSGCPCLLSEAVPREADVTGRCRFLPLGDPGAWARALASVRPGERLPVRDADFAEYDIERAALVLTERYEQLFEETCA